MTPDFGEPDAEWTDEFQWTRYKGPQPYPVPADWALQYVEGDGIAWQRFPGIGEGQATVDDVRDALDEDRDAVEEHRDVRAYLSNEIDSDASIRDNDPPVEQTLEIAGETVFRRVDPDYDDLLATTAEALARYSNDQDLGDLEPETGRPPEDVQRQREIEQRQSENQALDAFAGGERNA